MIFNKILYFLFTLINFFLFSNLAFSNQNIFNKCLKQIHVIENQLTIPKGMLTAIGKTESGRFLNNDIVIWPWTVNSNNKSLFFDTRSQIEKYVKKQIINDNLNLDVGCMQINLKWHGNNFKNILNAIDPMTNISYAISFLHKLERRHGSWKEAIKHYHSSKPEKNIKYLKKVEGYWKLPKKKHENNLALARINDIEDHIKKFQPNLYNDIKKIKLFRNIFMENSNK